MIQQLHHIIPKHSSYFDYLGDVKEDPYYKVYLTPEGHAAQHDVLYRAFGDTFDKIACNAMRGDCEARREVLSESGKRGGRAAPSPEAREKMAARKVGRKMSEETKRKMSEAHKGRKRPPMSEEHKAKLSKSLLGNTRRKDGKKTWKPDEEYKKNMSNILKGRKQKPVSEETRKKMSESAKARHKKKNVL